MGMISTGANHQALLPRSRASAPLNAAAIAGSTSGIGSDAANAEIFRATRRMARRLPEGEHVRGGVCEESERVEALRKRKHSVHREQTVTGLESGDAAKRCRAVSIEPPVCVPMATGTIPAATAAADPLELPPGVCARLRGLCVAAGVVYANAVVCVLPKRTPPRWRSWRTIAASSVPIRPL